VFIKNIEGVGEPGPRRDKEAIYGDFKEVAFIFVHRSERLFFFVVNDQVFGSDERKAKSAAGQNQTVLDTKSHRESIDVVRNVFVAANRATGEGGHSLKISRTSGA
jgi:hypothetical protein